MSVLFSEDYADTFLVMAENGVLKRDEVEHLGEMARFRNRLVHQYWRIDDDIIWEILIKDLTDITDYSGKILNLIKS